MPTQPFHGYFQAVWMCTTWSPRPVPTSLTSSRVKQKPSIGRSKQGETNFKQAQKALWIWLSGFTTEFITLKIVLFHPYFFSFQPLLLRPLEICRCNWQRTWRGLRHLVEESHTRAPPCSEGKWPLMAKLVDKFTLAYEKCFSSVDISIQYPFLSMVGTWQENSADYLREIHKPLYV